MNRTEILSRASKYIMEDMLYLSKMREGKRKRNFFSPTFLEGLVYDAIDDVLREEGKKFSKINRAAYVTQDTLKQLENKNHRELVLEHIVCKNIYYSQLKDLLFTGKLTDNIIFEILDKYYITALVTKREDQVLDAAGLRTKMVADGEWDGRNVFARYTATNIKLIRNPYYIFEE
ncbi:hypothetical protein [Bacillus sp. JJ722]|uniref:hypothetical protein n=1 Tax=Bacillus sp. JJ722 TaxID=3122973 RepID=UPI002FFE5205